VGTVSFKSRWPRFELERRAAFDDLFREPASRHTAPRMLTSGETEAVE